MAVILRVDGSKEKVSLENGTDFSLEELHKIMGGYIEVVMLKDPKYILVVDEEGKLKGKELNVLASLLYGQDEDYIVGDVLLCKSTEVK